MPDGHDMDVKESDAPRAGQTENRLVGRVLSHWEDIRDVRNFPSYTDYQDQETPYGDEHIFVIFISDSELSNEIVAAGKKVEEGFGRSPVGRKTIEVIPSSVEKGLSFCGTAARMKKRLPILVIFPTPTARKSGIGPSCYRCRAIRLMWITFSARLVSR